MDLFRTVETSTFRQCRPRLLIESPMIQLRRFSYGKIRVKLNCQGTGWSKTERHPSGRRIRRALTQSLRLPASREGRGLQHRQVGGQFSGES